MMIARSSVTVDESVSDSNGSPTPASTTASSIASLFVKFE